MSKSYDKVIDLFQSLTLEQKQKIWTTLSENLSKSVDERNADLAAQINELQKFKEQIKKP